LLPRGDGDSPFEHDTLQLAQAFAIPIAQAVERLRMTEEAQRTRVAAETEALRNALLSAISHDFRSPLSAIVSAATGLVEGQGMLTEEERLDLTLTVKDEARRLIHLADNILDMARFEAGAVRLALEPHSIEDIVGAILTRLRRRLSDHLVVTRLQPRLPLVKVDAVMIGQVLENLLDNAVKFSPAGQTILVGAGRTDDGLEICVADRGPGVSAESRLRIFERFYQDSLGHAVGGAGLGLAICRAIVEAHGQRLWVDDRGESGAVFRFTLPIAEETARV
jgi:two-component system sensor histidine kinase KdpD